MRAWLAGVIALVLAAPALAAERARDPSQATVFVRVVGKVQIHDPALPGSGLEERNVELGTGSGFLFTPFGHVLTNHHVVSGGTAVRQTRGREIRIRLTVERVEVVLPAGDPASGSARLDASIEASDEELDLAVLSVAGGDLPYLAFGDSDAAESGENVTVYGFPFGRQVEVGRANLPDIAPTVSVTRGSMSAARADGAGNTAFLQTSATVNPGNSGGPMVDAEGFVLGVIRLKLKEGDGIGFAIPVNAVKDFLETRGYGGLLGVERLRLTEEQAFERKGLRLRFPDTMEDRSPARLRVSSDPEDASIRFFSDRVATPLTLAQLEELLLAGSDFGSFRATGARSSRVLEGGGAILGRAGGQDSVSGREEKIEYALFENGLEKVIVRYVGTAEAVAYNRSVLLESLGSARVASLLADPVDSVIDPEKIRWLSRALPAPAAPAIAVPDGWEEEISAPFPCRGLAPADSVLATSPAGDFTTSLRAAWWRRGPSPVEAARACSDRPGTFGAESYSYALDWLGVRYVVSGRFREQGEGELLQLEVVAPQDKEGFVRDLASRYVVLSP